MGDLEASQLIEAAARALLDSGPGSRVYTSAKLGNAMEQTEFRIGEVAMRAGVSVDALRYYERVKLLGSAEECGRVRDLLSKKIGELDGKMTAMKDLRRTLARHLSACERELETHGDSACCPVVAGGKIKLPQGKSGRK